MKWFVTVNVRAVMEARLPGKISSDHLLILGCLPGLFDSPKRKAFRRDSSFTWLHLDHLAAEMPIPFRNLRTKQSMRNKVSRIVADLRQIGILETQRGGVGDVLYARLTDLGRTLAEAPKQAFKRHRYDDAGVTDPVTPYIREPVTIEPIPPYPPEGGGDSATILRVQRLLEPKLKTPRLLTRNDRRAWENSRCVVLATSNSEWESLKAFYARPTDSKKGKYNRTSFASLVRNWNGEIAKASIYSPDRNLSLGSMQPEPKGWREYITKEYPISPYGFDASKAPWESLPSSVQRAAWKVCTAESGHAPEVGADPSPITRDGNPRESA